MLPEPERFEVDWEKRPPDQEFADRIRQCVANLAEAIRVATIAGLTVETQLNDIGYASFNEHVAVQIYRKESAVSKKKKKSKKKETIANITARFLGIYFQMKPQSPNP